MTRAHVHCQQRGLDRDLVHVDVDEVYRRRPGGEEQEDVPAPEDGRREHGVRERRERAARAAERVDDAEPRHEVDMLRVHGERAIPRATDRRRGRGMGKTRGSLFN
jgi:hypothetical protein